MKLISVIVPVYKVEAYLRQCLDSILASTYSNLEVIVVDDGSPDECPRICDEYAEKDSRVQVIHQENQGLVAARNAGLALAKGEYVGFVDSDDYISPIMYSELVMAIEKTQADMVACEHCYDETQLVCGDADGEREYIYMNSFDDQLAWLTNAPSVRKLTWTCCYVWNKLYRKDKIVSMFRTECLMCEDLRFNWDYIHQCEKTAVVPMALYAYRRNPQSITGTYHVQRMNPENVAKGVANSNIWRLIACQSPISDKTLKEYIGARAAYVTHGALWRIYGLGMQNEYKSYCIEARKFIKENCLWLARDSKTYSALLRMACWLSCHAFWIWRVAAKLYCLMQSFRH